MFYPIDESFIGASEGGNDLLHFIYFEGEYLYFGGILFVIKNVVDFLEGLPTEWILLTNIHLKKFILSVTTNYFVNLFCLQI